VDRSIKGAKVMTPSSEILKQNRTLAEQFGIEI
jgi:hypothetical protein